MHDAYEDRNLLALLVGMLADAQGYDVGFGVDPSEPEWPVLYIDLPSGQIAYHLPAELVNRLPYRLEYTGTWDGHSTDEKRERIWRAVTDGEDIPEPDE